MRRNSLINRIRKHPYFRYLVYLLRHKKWVAHMLFQRKMYIQGITHDLSKFRPDEFKRYARYYASNKQADIKEQWLHHMHRNKHHWQYWVLMDHDGNMRAMEMPDKYVMEMIADWYSVVICEKGFDNLQEDVVGWYNDRKANIFIHQNSREFLEDNLIIGTD